MEPLKKSFKMFMYNVKTNAKMNSWVPTTWLRKYSISGTTGAHSQPLAAQPEVTSALHFVLISVLFFFESQLKICIPKS